MRFLSVSAILVPLVVWTLLSVGQSLGTDKPFAQCFMSSKNHCE